MDKRMSVVGLQKSRGIENRNMMAQNDDKRAFNIQTQFGAGSITNANVNKAAKRDRIEILLQMLEVANEPTRKTHLMYGGGINYYQLERHLGLLLQLGMIEEIALGDGAVSFRTTEKGRLFCQMFNQDGSKTTQFRCVR